MAETDNNALVLAIKENNVEAETGLALQNAFAPFFEQANEWKKTAETLKVTDVSQTREMLTARQARLALKEIRVNADKTRKRLKEDSLKYGKAVQSVYNLIEYLIEPIEKYLQEQEDFPKIQEAKRKEALAAERAEQLAKYDCLTGGFNLGDMDESSFQSLLNGTKLSHEADIEAKRKAEEERIENARIERLHCERREQILPFFQWWEPELRDYNLGKISDEEFFNILTSLQLEKSDYEEEQKRITAENERLKKEKEETDRVLAKERLQAEADKKALEEKARKEREEKEKEIKRLQAAAAEAAKREAAEKAKIEAKEKEAAKQQRKAAAAPDKVKLIALANHFNLVAMPNLSTEEGRAVLKQVQELQIKLVNFINQKAETL